jgi:hypothetical protein
MTLVVPWRPMVTTRSCDGTRSSMWVPILPPSKRMASTTRSMKGSGATVGVLYLGYPYKKPVDQWHFSHDVLRKHQKHALSVMLTIFSSQIDMLDIRPILLWHFLRFITNQPIILWCFSHSSQINKPFVTFYKIYNGWRTNSPVSMDPPIVFCLRGMNISCLSHMSVLHRKELFLLLKYNIMSSWWST